jgi:hypothetical protein
VFSIVLPSYRVSSWIDLSHFLSRSMLKKKEADFFFYGLPRRDAIDGERAETPLRLVAENLESSGAR